jgi:glycosyltransferase involved in cell wall biosynthesis
VREPARGVSRARNAGARAASAPVVAFLDDDAVPEPDWLATHLRALEDGTLAATTGRILPTGPGAGEDLGPQPVRLDASAPQWFERANFGGLGLGPNLAMRRELFREGWGFRETLGPGMAFDGEEHYAFFDLIRRGHALAYVPDAVVAHRAPAGDELERYRRRMLRGGVAYAVMLLVEEPGYRRRVLRYALGGMRGAARDWRPAGAPSRPATRRERLDAVVHGPLLYLRSRRS